MQHLMDFVNSKNIVAAVVGSRLDCCNFLLYGVSGTNLSKLQRVQNLLAGIVVSSDVLFSTNKGHKS